MKKIIFIVLTFAICSMLFANCKAQVTQEWVATYSGGAQNLGAQCMALDTNGNIYVTGVIIQPSTSNDIATVKYNTNGVQQWVAIFNSTNNGPDLVSAITTDISGNVYITGTNYTPQGGNYAFITVKYNTNGVQQWLSNYTGPYGTGEANDIVVDKQGNVYITGYTIYNDPNASRHFITIKYNSSGTQQWVRTYGAAGQFGSYARGGLAITLDDSTNVYVTGNTQGGGSPWYTTIKYNGNGVQQWLAYETDVYGFGNQICLDKMGNVISAGLSQINSAPNFTTIKYSNTGIKRWMSTYPAGLITGLGIDNLNNVYVTGMDINTTTIKYDQSGVQQWLQSYVGPHFIGSRPGLVLDTFTNVYVGCSSINASIEDDYLTIKYSSGGVQQWTVRYNGPGNSIDELRDIKKDKYSNIFVTGGSNSAFVTIKYSQFNNIRKITSSIPKEFALSQNYPNPFNPRTIINFQLPMFSNVKLIIYDVLGREIDILVNQQLKPGTYEVSWDASNYPSGVYFYKLTAGDASAPLSITKKMVLVK